MSIYFPQIHGYAASRIIWPSSNPRWYFFIFFHYYSEPSTRDISSWRCTQATQEHEHECGRGFWGGRLLGGPKVSADCCSCGWRQPYTRQIDHMEFLSTCGCRYVWFIFVFCGHILIISHPFACVLSQSPHQFSIHGGGLKWGHAGRGLPWGQRQIMAFSARGYEWRSILACEICVGNWHSLYTCTCSWTYIQTIFKHPNSAQKRLGLIWRLAECHPKAVSCGEIPDQNGQVRSPVPLGALR